MAKIKNTSWWGEFDFALNQTKCWRIGERTVFIRRSEKEWTVWNKECVNENNEAIVVDDIESEEPIDKLSSERFILSNTSKKLFVEPSLADRAMVVRPSKPIIVMPGEQAKLFISTPLWMTLSIEDKDAPMVDIPFWRPSDSWFGATTMSGDLCYSKYTDAKLNADNLEIRSHRASTLVTVLNDQDENLLIQRLNLPVPLLKVYANENNQFWTDQVNIVQSNEHSMAVSHISHSPPEHFKSLTQVSESRELSNKSSLMSSIKNLIG